MMKNQSAIKLREIGLKVTPQRQAILKVLKGNRTHPSAENIYHGILKEYPAISFATVYNTLSKLAETEAIQALDIDPNKKRFDPRLSPHSHFYCRVCKKIYDVEEGHPFPKGVQRTSGHIIEAVQINLKGVCKVCCEKRRG
jgi:Fur family transcriptional regulator, peroxide stress response regulator